MRFLPIKLHLQIMHRVHAGRWIDFSSPKTFTEKLQWLKLNKKNPSYALLVDKIKVKDYVKEVIGDDYIVPTIRVFDSLESITMDELPDKFVLKTSHAGGGGGVFVCKDKSKFDLDAAKRVLKVVLEKNWYRYGREYPYKDLTPRVFCEKLLEIDDNIDLPDYKFYCFNGVPEYCQLIQNRSTAETIDFYDMKWNRLEFWGLNVRTKKADEDAICPVNYDHMIDVARRLSKGMPFVRVDLYNINGRIYFGELTFFPASGFGRFTPDKYNYIIGEKLKL